MSQVTGSMTATGATAPVTGRKIDIAMDFGSGSVDVERRLPSGAWIKIATGITADYNYIAEFPAPVAIRLNCTSYTSSIEYSLSTGPED